MKILELHKMKNDDKVIIKGWATSIRGNNKIRFINLNDGSDFSGVQVVVKNNAEEFEKVRVGSAIEIEGILKITPERDQKIEVVTESFKILKIVDEDYPIQKQGMSMEVLRDIPHIRHRTSTFRAIMRIRSTLMQQIHTFFTSKNFLNVSSPIITSSDGEGAGEMFELISGDDSFFGKKALLGVTGQLHAEAYSTGFGDVYTFAPTFRAENSNTKRHVAEFWMLEPEIAFGDKFYAINLVDEMLKKIISTTMEIHKEEFLFLDKLSSNKLIKKLSKFNNTKIKTMSYQNAINELAKVKDIFTIKDIKFGIDLATEHERYLAEVVVGGPVAVFDYPKEIKAFYMKVNDDNKTVGGFDILVPGVGEMVGGSERETDYVKLTKRINEMGINKKELEWYSELRRFGQYQSVGFGVGFERLVMYVTGMENIRDVIPYPRTSNNLKM